jgi:hypothetical protein
MPRGQRPNVERRLQVSKLRAQGLSYRLIGQILGVTRQCVHALLRSTDPEGLTYIACCVCGVKITRWRGPRPDPVFCPSCLPADASLAQKIRSYRVALGLTYAALAARTGISVGSIIAYECGQRPGPRNGAKLSRYRRSNARRTPQESSPTRVHYGANPALGAGSSRANQRMAQDSQRLDSRSTRRDMAPRG